MFVSDNFFAIKSKDIDEVSYWVRPFLEEFERKTFLVSADDVLEQARNADAQLWSYFDGTSFRGVMATRIHKTSLGLMCNIWVCVGLDALELVEGSLQEVENWAKEIGCYAIEIVGREGWQKKVPGFTKKAIVLEKILARSH